MIRTYYYQEHKPAEIHNDSRGVMIDIGLRIAYNQSGNVVLGKISRIIENTWKVRKYSKGGDWILNFKMEVINEDSSISIIKNPNSFIII